MKNSQYKFTRGMSLSFIIILLHFCFYYLILRVFFTLNIISIVKIKSWYFHS